MTENKAAQTPAAVSLREVLGRDGHLIENAAALIAHQASQIRNLYPEGPSGSLRATSDLTSAIGGIGKTKLPSESVQMINQVGIALNHADLFANAINAGLSCSPQQIKELDQAFDRGGVIGLREAALKLPLTVKPGERPATLGDKIKSFP